jgi:hypothetical protein
VIDLNVSLDRENYFRFRVLLANGGRRAAAQSLTFTAERAQAAWRAENHHAFHMRRTWIDKGVRIKHATAGNLVAQVGTIDKYMGRHVKGVDTPKESAGKGLFVPIEPIASQGSHTQIRAKLKRMAGTKTQPFWRHGVLMRRLGKGHGAALKVLAVMRHAVTIKPRLDAEGVVYQAVRHAYPPVYERLLLKALAQGART